MPPAPASSRNRSRPSRVAATAQDFDEGAIELVDAPPQEDLDDILWLEPVPASAQRPRPAPSPPAPGRPLPEPPGVTGPAEFSEPPPPIPSRPRTKRPRPVAQTVARPQPAPPETPPAIGPGQIVVSVKKKRVSRIAVVVAAVGLLAVSTFAVRSWRHRLQELPHIAETNGVEGLAALEQGRFDEARSKLSRAAAAYRDLKATDEAASTMIQFAAEAEILAGLTGDTLKEIVEEVARLGETKGQEYFASTSKDRAILVDSEVESARGKVELAYRIFVGRGPVPGKIGRLDLSGFTLFEGRKFQSGDRVIFGAKLGSISLEDGEWRIALVPESGVLMTNTKALAIAFEGTGESSR